MYKSSISLSVVTKSVFLTRGFTLFSLVLKFWVTDTAGVAWFSETLVLEEPLLLVGSEAGREASLTVLSLVTCWAGDGPSGALLAPFAGAPTWGPAASNRPWTVFRLVLEVVGRGGSGWDTSEGGTSAAFICSDSFCFFILADDGTDAGPAEAAVCDRAAAAFLLCFDGGPALTAGVCGELLWLNWC